MTKDQFIPDTITVNVGSTVTWTNKDWYVKYIIVSNSTNAQFESPVLQSGDSYNHKFNTVGVYQYYNKETANSQRGTIIVQP